MIHWLVIIVYDTLVSYGITRCVTLLAMREHCSKCSLYIILMIYIKIKEYIEHNRIALMYTDNTVYPLSHLISLVTYQFENFKKSTSPSQRIDGLRENRY